MDIEEIEKPEFWDNSWQQFQQASKPQQGFQNPGVWQATAKFYNSGGTSEEVNNRVIALLKKRGVVITGTSILDIGSGPGTFAIPFAHEGARVKCIDISHNMINRLKAEIPVKLKRRISAVAADWQTYEPGDERYDLVFAHMTPAINTPEALYKLISFSRNWCYLAGWAGARIDQPLDDLWSLLLQKPRNQGNHHFYFALNLLYTMRYFPEIHFYKVSWEFQVPTVAMIEVYTELFDGRTDNDRDTLRKKISTCLTQIENNGELTRTINGHIGYMLWPTVS